LKGAGTGEDAGGESGSLTHSHTLDHGHTSVNHSHTGVTGAGSDTCHKLDYPGGGGAACTCYHTHNVTLNNTSVSCNNYSGSGGSAESVEPAYRKLLAIQSSGDKSSAPKGLIGLWLNSLSSIPNGWYLCDGNNGTLDMRDKFFKIANTESEAGDTGGSHTHSHAASNSHTHTATGLHTHTGSTNIVVNEGGTGVADKGVSKTHSHTLNTVDSKTPTWQNSTISSDSSNSEPAYRTAALVMFQFMTGGGPFFSALI